MSQSTNSIFQRGSSKSSFRDYLEKVVLIGTIFGFGFATGMYINSNDHKVELMKAQQEYYQKLHDEINKYRDCRIEDQEQKISELNKSVQVLRTINAKSEKK